MLATACRSAGSRAASANDDAGVSSLRASSEWLAAVRRPASSSEEPLADEGAKIPGRRVRTSQVPQGKGNFLDGKAVRDHSHYS